MRVLLVCKTYLPIVGGVERHVSTLARALAGEHEVTVLTMRTTPRPDSPLDGSLWPCPRFDPYTINGVRIVQLRPEPSNPLRYLPFAVRVTPVVRTWFYGRRRLALARLLVPALSRAIGRHAADADMVHVCGDEFLALAGVRAARAAGLPVAVHGFVHEHAWGDDPVSQRAYQEADVCIAIRDEEAGSYHRLGVAPDRVRTCGEGTPAPTIDRPAHDQPLVLFLGRRAPYKGIDLLCAAADRIAAAVPGAKIAFVGSGPALQTTSSAIIDVGEVSDAERDSWLARADVVALPSAHETYGLCLLEAWAHKVPVVTSDIPVLAGLLAEAGGGIAVPRTVDALSEALITLLTDADRRRQFGERGHAYWQAEGSVQGFLDRHLAIYQDILVGAGQAAPRSS